MSAMIAPPEEATLEELESFTSRINRAFQELPRNTYATIAGQEVELTDMDSAIRTLITTGAHDQLTGVENSTKHALFLLLDGSRAMTGDLNTNLNDVYLGQAVAGANGALTGNASSGGGAPSIHTVEFMPHYQSGINKHGWRIYDRDYVGASPAAYLCIGDVAGVARLYAGPELQATDLIASTKVITDVISERTATAGVTIDSMLVKDGHILLTALGGYVAQGDLIVGGAADWSILSTGSAGQILLTDGTDPGWTTTFTADMLFSAGKKAYFEAAGSTPGTEWWTSDNDTFLDAHFAGGVRFYSSVPDLLLTLKPRAGAVTQTHLEAPINLNIYIGGSRIAIFDDGVTGINLLQGRLVIQDDLLIDADNEHLQLGEGQDMRLYFDGGDCIYYGTAITATAKHLFGTTGTETIVCGSLETNAGMLLEQTTISAATTLSAAHHIVLCDTNTAGAPFTVTLPAAASHADRVYEIINTGNSGYDVTVDGNGAEEINRATTQIVGDGSSMMIVCDGAAWWVR
jgi:hypothetical protein